MHPAEFQPAMHHLTRRQYLRTAQVSQATKRASGHHLTETAGNFTFSYRLALEIGWQERHQWQLCRHLKEEIDQAVELPTGCATRWTFMPALTWIGKQPHHACGRP